MQYLSKKEYVYEQLKKDINDGILRPGDKLVISSLEEKYGMSNIPIREAISQLFHEGLVENVPYVGAKVAEFNIEMMFEITWARYRLEEFLFTTAIENLNDKSLSDLENIIDDLENMANNSDIKQYMVANRKFYSEIYAKSSVEYIKKVVDDLYARSRINTSLSSPSQIPASIKRRREMLMHLRKGENELAIKCHKEQKIATILSVLDTMESAVSNPDNIENTTVAHFYRGKDVKKNKEIYLKQIKDLQKLYKVLLEM